MTRPAFADLQRMDEDVRAWAYLAPDQPSHVPVAGPLHGMRFGVKDVIDVRGMPTRFGADMPGVQASRFDAACVTMLRDAGAEPIGKTVTAEFAWAAPGPTRNPHNLAHTPGGSSSGSAAAVSAGMVDFALGTQTGGSMIRPAAFNGVVGFKPTFGRVPRAGMQVLCDSLDTIGWFTPDVALSQVVAGVFMSPTASAPINKDTLSIAVLPCTQLGSLSRDALHCLQRGSDALRLHGFNVDWLDSIPLEVDTLDVHGAIMRYEFSRSMLPILRSEPSVLRPQTMRVLNEGLAISTAEYDQLRVRRKGLDTAWLDRLSHYDLMLAPSAPGAAPEGLESTGSSVFNRIWSLLGWPTVHLPMGANQHSLPLGVQCIGLPNTDMTLLDRAAQLHGLIDKRSLG